MSNLKQYFDRAVASSADRRGKPAMLGKTDGTLYWTDPAGAVRRDKVWARIGESGSNQEAVVRCTAVTPQIDMPVRVDMVNGVLSVVAVDEKRYLSFSGNRPGGNIGAHAWLHGRLGPDPLYLTGLQYLPLLVHPSNPAAMTVTVEQGAYRWEGTYKIFETAASGSLSAYIPASALVKHFVIVCLDRANNALVIVDGDDVSLGGDALFGGASVTAADVTAVTIAAAYLPLAAVLLYYGQTEVRAADVVMDLRTWGGESVGTQGDSPYLPSTMWRNSALYPCAEGSLGDLFTFRLDDTAVEAVIVHYYVTIGGSAYWQAVVDFAMESATSGDVVVQMDMSVVRNGYDAVAVVSGATVTETVPGTAKQRGQITIAADNLASSVLGNVTVQAGDILKLRFFRNGNDAADTATGDLHFIGAKLTLS